MSEQKRYYWLKLQHDFFKSLRIKKLRKIAGGDTYTIIYLKMQLKCLADGGYWYYKGVLDSFEEEVALDIDEEVDDVKITIQYLLSCGLMEVTENPNTYIMPYVFENVGSEGASAQRMRNLRQRQQTFNYITDASQCDINVTDSLRTRYVEKEIEIEKEKEKEKELEKDTTPLPPSKGKQETQEELFNRLSEGKQLSDPLKEKLHEWIQYKKELKQSYKEMGMKSFITQMERYEQEYGTSDLINCITLSMARGYRGIITNLIDKGKPQRSVMDDWKDVIV